MIYTQRTQKNRGEIDKREHSARVLEVRPRRVVIEVRIDGVLRCMRVRSHLVRALSA